MAEATAGSAAMMTVDPVATAMPIASASTMPPQPVVDAAPAEAGAASAVSTAASAVSAAPSAAATAPVAAPSSEASAATDALHAYKVQESLQEERLKAQTEMLPKRKLEELVKQIDPNQELDHEVEELLVDMANDFIERVVTFSCQLAKHRGSDVLEVKDVQLHLERNWNIRVPGYPREDARVAKPMKPSEGHKQRLGAVQKDSASKRRKMDDGR